MLRGAVVDQAALIGLLVRLRQHGLQVQDLVPVRRTDRDEPVDGAGTVVEVEIVGLVTDLLARTLGAAEVSQDPATTTVRVGLRSPDGLFALLDRLEDLSLAIRRLRVHQDDDSTPPVPPVG